MKISVWTLLAFLLGLLLGARAESRLHKMMGCELSEKELIERIAGAPPASPGTFQPFNPSTFQP